MKHAKRRMKNAGPALPTFFTLHPACRIFARLSLSAANDSGKLLRKLSAMRKDASRAAAHTPVEAVGRIRQGIGQINGQRQQAARS
jgi:hypothetical protein